VFARPAHSAAALAAASADGGSELERMIARGGCAEAFYALELCMGESGRVWAACQPQVRALRRCRDDAAGRAEASIVSTDAATSFPTPTSTVAAVAAVATSASVTQNAPARR